MASPQKENGNTGIANELFEKLLLFNFPSASPIKVWLFIARKTYGYQKKTDHISLTQIEQGTNLSRQTVNESLKWLVKACLLVKGDSNEKGTVYGVNKDYEQWVVNTTRLVKDRRLGSQGVLTHNINIYNKKNTVKNKFFTPKIKLMNEEYPLDELIYESVASPKSKSKYGSKTMAILARKFAEVAGIEIGQTFDASEWSKPLSTIYRRFGKDADKTMRFFEEAGKWYNDKGLTFTPHTLEKNFTMLKEKWLKSNSQDPRFE